MKYRIQKMILITLLVGTAIACGDENEQSSQSVGAVCETVSDCAENSTCLRVGNAASCALVCDVSANECGGSASCAGVGSLAVNVCQPTPKEGEAPKPEEQPQLPCANDAECNALYPGAVCGSFRGMKDCTLPCSVESDCDLPALGGISLDFMTCATDAGQTSRTVCLPDEKCFSNITSCITGDLTGGFGDLDEDDKDMIDDIFGGGDNGEDDGLGD